MQRIKVTQDRFKWQAIVSPELNLQLLLPYSWSVSQSDQ